MNWGVTTSFLLWCLFTIQHKTTCHVFVLYLSQPLYFLPGHSPTKITRTNPSIASILFQPNSYRWFSMGNLGVPSHSPVGSCIRCPISERFASDKMRLIISPTKGQNRTRPIDRLKLHIWQSTRVATRCRKSLQSSVHHRLRARLRY